jgi:hypothetical protein
MIKFLWSEGVKSVKYTEEWQFNIVITVWVRGKFMNGLKDAEEGY